MTKKEFFSIMPARQFFPRFCPEVKNWYHKLRGASGNGRPIDFSPTDKEQIREGLERALEALKTSDFLAQ